MASYNLSFLPEERRDADRVLIWHEPVIGKQLSYKGLGAERLVWLVVQETTPSQPRHLLQTSLESAEPYRKIGPGLKAALLPHRSPHATHAFVTDQDGCRKRVAFEHGSVAVVQELVFRFVAPGGYLAHTHLCQAVTGDDWLVVAQTREEVCEAVGKDKGIIIDQCPPANSAKPVLVQEMYDLKKLLTQTIFPFRLGDSQRHGCVGRFNVHEAVHPGALRQQRQVRMPSWLSSCARDGGDCEEDLVNSNLRDVRWWKVLPGRVRFFLYQTAEVAKVLKAARRWPIPESRLDELA